MPLPTLEDIYEMEDRPVFVTTSSGRPISLGRFRVTPILGAAGVRADIIFETETMSCVIGVSPLKLQAIIPTWDGDFYRYTLPPGERVWAGESEQVQELESDSPAPTTDEMRLGLPEFR